MGPRAASWRKQEVNGATADGHLCRGRGERSFQGEEFSGPWGMTGHIFKVRWRGMGPRLAETSRALSSGKMLSSTQCNPGNKVCFPQ